MIVSKCVAGMQDVKDKKKDAKKPAAKVVHISMHGYIVKITDHGFMCSPQLHFDRCLSIVMHACMDV